MVTDSYNTQNNEPKRKTKEFFMAHKMPVKDGKLDFHSDVFKKHFGE